MSARRILVVDDDDAVRGVAVRQVTSLGHRALAAGSGGEAIALIESTPDLDLLFVDLSMPGMGGAEVAERALHLRPGLKVLFASGNFDSAAAPAGAQFIIKPYRKKDLAEKINAMLAISPT